MPFLPLENGFKSLKETQNQPVVWLYHSFIYHQTPEARGMYPSPDVILFINI